MSDFKRKVTGRECPVFRLGFESLFEATAYEDQEPKYSITMLFDPAQVDVTKSSLMVAAIEAGKEKFGDRFKVGPKGEWPKGFKSPFRDGDEMEAEFYHGTVFVRASNKKSPVVVDESLMQLTPETGPSKVYAGCYCRAVLVAFGYEVNGNKGVSFSVQAVQKVKDGERLSVGKAFSVQSEFDAVEGGDDFGW